MKIYENLFLLFFETHFAIPVFSEAHGFHTFSLRDFENETRTRLGLKECIGHEVIQEQQVMQERPGELVAQFKYTVLVLPHGILKVTVS